MRRVLCTIVVCLLGTLAPARAEWLVNQQGACVRQWTPDSLLLGPAVILDVPLLPIRFIEGGVVEAAECPAEECGVAKRTGLGVAGVIIGALSGFFGVFSDVVTGFGDTVTGGVFEFTAPDPTRLTLWPIRFVPLADVYCFFGRPQDPTIDPCGRVEFEVPPEDQFWRPPWWQLR
ncbi:MAG: hypothetical protein ABI629_11020 [bacterium]